MPKDGINEKEALTIFMTLDCETEKKTEIANNVFLFADYYEVVTNSVVVLESGCVGVW